MSNGIHVEIRRVSRDLWNIYIDGKRVNGSDSAEAADEIAAELVRKHLRNMENAGSFEARA
jgi:hypothetical protein